MSQALRVAIVGCGQIADAHLQEIQYIPGAKVVAVCDQLPELASQAARRYAIADHFASLDEMIRHTRPEVVHLTTPPHTHAALACDLLARGIHVYVEKPFAVDLAETEQVIEVALANHRLVCVGHDHLFDPIWQQMEAHIDAGMLGDVVHVDSIMGYNLDGPFGRMMFSDRNHWVHRLPGGLFHNNISHALYKVTPFLTDASPRFWATTNRCSPDSTPTELRVLVQGRTASASIFFSSIVRPVRRCVHLYGTKATVEVDWDGRVVRWQRGPKLPGALGKIDVPWRHLHEAGRNLMNNCWDLVRSRQHYFSGMRHLFTRFYQAIAQGADPPISYREICRIAGWMDEIFRQCKRRDEYEVADAYSRCSQMQLAP